MISLWKLIQLNIKDIVNLTDSIAEGAVKNLSCVTPGPLSDVKVIICGKSSPVTKPLPRDWWRLEPFAEVGRCSF